MNALQISSLETVTPGHLQEVHWWAEQEEPQQIENLYHNVVKFDNAHSGFRKKLYISSFQDDEGNPIKEEYFWFHHTL